MCNVYYRYVSRCGLVGLMLNSGLKKKNSGRMVILRSQVWLYIARCSAAYLLQNGGRLPRYIWVVRCIFAPLGIADGGLFRKPVGMVNSPPWYNVPFITLVLYTQKSAIMQQT